MSEKRSKSPHCRTSPHRHSDRSRRFPWDEPDFDPQKLVAQLDGRPFETKHHRREDPQEHWRYSREGIHSDKQRRSPSFRGSHHQPTGRQHHPHPEELHRKTSPFLPDELDYAERLRLSPMRPPHGHNGRKRERERAKEAFQDIFNNFQQRDRPLYSPDRLAPTAPSHSKHQPRDSSTGWRREDRGRGQGRPRNLSPRPSSDSQGRDERDRGRRDTHSSHMERQREDSHRERSPFSRHKREMDGPVSLGYGKEEELRERHRDAFGGGPRDSRSAGPVVVEHRHGFTNNTGPSQWDLDQGGRACNDDKRCGRSGQTESLHDRFRKLNRSEAWEENRVQPVQDGRRDPSCETRSSAQNTRNGPVGFPEPGGPIKLRGSGALHPVRGGEDAGRGGRRTTGSPRNHPDLQQPSQKRQAPPSLLSLGFHPRQGGFYMKHKEEEPERGNQGELRQWESNRPGDKSQNLPRKNPKTPRQREHVWKSQQAPDEMREDADEMLTIKVDMGQLTNKNSALCYSSDRQLSLDLVNVGRQRLDFLPMLEHSGTYRESTIHTGTFAQEIITLVHQVKEHYFRGNTITLNERFSAPQDGRFPKEELQVPDEEERPTLNTRFTMSMNTMLDSEPVFAIQPDSPQPARDPADLRHNLERRRQGRVDGVKITIAGGSLSQHPLASGSEPVPLFDETSVMEEAEEGGGFFSWSGLHQPGRRGGAGNRGPRRGAFHRNRLLGNRLGPPRR